MTAAISIYLDIFRFGAALLVLIFHLSYFTGVRIPLIGNLGNEAVLAFFVLSGFVIAYSVSQKHRDLRDFSISRLSRLWSVVIPAFAVTFIVDKLGQHIDLLAYAPLQVLPAWKWLVLFPVNTLFLGQIWDLDLWVGTDGPFWSLCYEFWYYAIFGLAYYLRGRGRLIAVLVTSGVAGPKILLAFPVWLSGVAVFYLISKVRIGARLGLLIYISSIGLIIAYSYFDVTKVLHETFGFAASYADKTKDVDFWPRSYSIGLLLALNFYGFNSASRLFSIELAKHQRSIRKVADLSFGIYMFHYPFGFFSKAIALGAFSLSKNEAALFIYLATCSLSILFAFICEKGRRRFDNFLKRCERLVVDVVKSALAVKSQ